MCARGLQNPEVVQVQLMPIVHKKEIEYCIIIPSFLGVTSIRLVHMMMIEYAILLQWMRVWNLAVY